MSRMSELNIALDDAQDTADKSNEILAVFIQGEADRETGYYPDFLIAKAETMTADRIASQNFTVLGIVAPTTKATQCHAQ